MLQDVFRVDAAFALVIRLISHGPGEVLRVSELGCAGRDEELRHLLGVHVFLDRGIGRGAERLVDQQHLVAFDELARLLDGLRRRVGVIIGNEGDLAAVDAALLVDHAEIGGFGPPDGAIGRSGPRVRHDVADLDLGVACAWVVFLLRERGSTGHDHAGRR